MKIRKHILALFSTTLVLTGTSLAPVMSVTSENITMSKAMPSEEFRKFESQDSLFSGYLPTSDFALTWQTLLAEISKKDLETQIKAIEAISNLHIDEVNNLKELKNIEVKLKALHVKMTTKADEKFDNFEWLKFLVKGIWNNEEFRKVVFASQDEEMIMFLFLGDFILTWKKITDRN